MAIWVWLILAVVFIILELCTGEFVLGWFAVGSFIAEILALCDVVVWVQVLVFALVSVVLLVSLRKLVLNAVLKQRDKKLKKYALDKTGVVKKEIANELLYVCSFNKKNFVVMLQTPAKLNIGEKVKVNSVINGVAIGLPEDGRVDFILSDNEIKNEEV